MFYLRAWTDKQRYRGHGDRSRHMSKSDFDFHKKIDGSGKSALGMTIVKNITHTLRRIEKACAAVDRNPADVRLLLATKTVPPENIKIALNTGQVLIGENEYRKSKKNMTPSMAFPTKRTSSGICKPTRSKIY